MDIKTRLTRCCGNPVGGYKCGDGIRCPDCFDKLEGWREIERLSEVLLKIKQESNEEHIREMAHQTLIWEGKW